MKQNTLRTIIIRIRTNQLKMLQISNRRLRNKWLLVLENLGNKHLKEPSIQQSSLQSVKSSPTRWRRRYEYFRITALDRIKLKASNVRNKFTFIADTTIQDNLKIEFKENITLVFYLCTILEVEKTKFKQKNGKKCSQYSKMHISRYDEDA